MNEIYDYTMPVSFDYNDDYEKELARIQNINDNAIYLNSVISLLTDKDTPFVKDKELSLFLEYVDSKRPEIQDRAKTLRLIREYRDAWFENGEVDAKRDRINELYRFMLDNKILLERTPVLLNKQVDLNYAVVMALNEPDFHFSDKNNPVRKEWEKLSAQTSKLFESQKQNLYSK